MKYEFKSTYREFLGIYCALIISTLLTWMVDLPQLEVVGYIASICVFAVIVAAIVIGDEAEAFFRIEPFNCTVVHVWYLQIINYILRTTKRLTAF